MACQAGHTRLRLSSATRFRAGTRVSWFDRLRGRLGNIQVNGSCASLLRLERSSLRRTAGNRIELSTVEKVLEVGTRCEDNVHRLDVRRGEVLQLVSPLTAERDPEVAELTHLHLLPFEKHLDEAFAHVDDHATHRST